MAMPQCSYLVKEVKFVEFQETFVESYCKFVEKILQIFTPIETLYLCRILRTYYNPTLSLVNIAGCTSWTFNVILLILQVKDIYYYCPHKRNI